MNFCSHCGQPVKKVLITGDSHPRFQCGSCARIHYQNPKVLVSCYATWGKKVLWMRRGIEPCIGKWTAPSGFVEEGESLEQAAARELYEETRARVDPEQMQLHMIGNLVRMSQIYVVFRAPLLSPEFSPTKEASEVQLFGADEFPIEDFAFPEVADNIRLFYRDLESACFGVYMGTLHQGLNTIRKVDRENL